MMVQIIISPSGERLVVIAEDLYRELVAAAEDSEDLREVEGFRRRLAAGEEELVPASVVDRILEGESRVKVWREHRGLSARGLAEMADIAPAFLSQIETGKRSGTIETIQRLALALRLSVEDLISPAVDPAYQRIEDLLGREPDLSISELATSLHASESHVRRCCDWLKDEGRVVSRSGRPVRYALASSQSSSTR